MVRPSRRQFLALSVAGVSVALAGCTRGNTEAGDETATHSPEPTDASQPGCWPSMCAGTQLIEVAVRSGFSGAVVLEASCRDDARSIQPGETVEIVRETDAEECGVTLSVDDERVYDERIEGHASVTVTVMANGDIDEEVVVL